MKEYRISISNKVYDDLENIGDFILSKYTQDAVDNYLKRRILRVSPDSFYSKRNTARILVVISNSPEGNKVEPVSAAVDSATTLY